MQVGLWVCASIHFMCDSSGIEQNHSFHFSLQEVNVALSAHSYLTISQVLGKTLILEFQVATSPLILAHAEAV